MFFKNDEEINRLLIYFFYDKDGIVDNYITFFLSALEKFTNKIIFVSNGSLTSESKNLLNKIDKLEIFERENVGFDVMAYKDAIYKIGWEKLAKYDEMILANYTQFGPVYPFDEMFNQMDKKDIDFWGITKHHKMDKDPFGGCIYGYIPEHIQSSFIVIRNSLLKSKIYHNFWDNIKEIKSYGEAVTKYEAIFTKYFEDNGFKSDVYINTEDLREVTRYPLMMTSLELIKNRKCPIFKRKSFAQSYFDMLSEGCGDESKRLLSFIDKETEYDVNLVWDNILRCFNMADIKNQLNFNYIIDEKSLISEEALSKKIKCCVIIHIHYTDILDYCFDYIKNVPEWIDIIITTNSEKKKSYIENYIKDYKIKNYEIRLVENRGRDVSAILTGCNDIFNKYEYACFVHDKKSSQIKPELIGEKFSDRCFDNCLCSKNYIINIINKFEEEKRLGILMPPPPNHGHYFQTFYSCWSNNFNNTKKLAKELNINVDIDINKPPISPLGTMFWFRTRALEKLFKRNFKYEEYPAEPNKCDGTMLHAIERLYGFAVQANGYYCGWLLNKNAAENELTNLHYMLEETVKSSNKNYKQLTDVVSANCDMFSQIPMILILKVKLRNRLPKNLFSILKKLYRLIKK